MLHNVVGRPAISNCGNTTEKCSKFLDHHLIPIMQGDSSGIKDSCDFINQTKNLSSIPENAILVTADVLELYASISYETNSRTLRETLDKQDKKSIATEDLVKMVGLVLRTTSLSVTVKLNKFLAQLLVPQCVCLSLDEFEINFLKCNNCNPWYGSDTSIVLFKYGPIVKKN